MNTKKLFPLILGLIVVSVISLFIFFQVINHKIGSGESWRILFASFGLLISTSFVWFVLARFKKR